MFVTGLVLAAGSSSRLGQPKQLLPYRGTTLLDATLGIARACGFDQLLVTIGGASEEVRRRVDFSGTQVVENLNFTAMSRSGNRARSRATTASAVSRLALHAEHDLKPG